MGFEIAFHGAHISRSFPVIQVIAVTRWLWKFQNKGTIVHADNFACNSQLCRVVVSSQPVCSLHGGLTACVKIPEVSTWGIWFVESFGFVMRLECGLSLIVLFAKY